jgi:hypothetical protein
MLVRVHQGKGGKDHIVSLAHRPLERMQAYRYRERPYPWWFPVHNHPEPLLVGMLQKTFKTSSDHQRDRLPPRLCRGMPPDVHFPPST